MRFANSERLLAMATNQSSQDAKCKYCQSPNVIRFGTYKGVQRYYCKDCKRKFVLDTLPKMKTPMSWVAAALDMYYRGMPLDSIQGHMKMMYGKYFSEPGIYKWIVRFTQEAVRRARDFHPVVGDTWVADETSLNVDGRNIWYFDIIDADTRYLLASHLSTNRTTADAQVLVEKAIARAGKVPKVIITDKLQAYIDGIDLASGGTTKHIRSKPFTEEDSTNLIERFHGTLKERTDVIRNFGNLATARLLTEGWLLHYNFFKEHESLGSVPPVNTMKVKLPFADWNDIVKNAGGAKEPYMSQLETPKAKPMTQKQKRRAYMRRAVHKSQAKSKVTIPGITTLRE